MPLTLGVPSDFVLNEGVRWDLRTQACWGEDEAIRSQNSSETRQIRVHACIFMVFFCLLFGIFPSFQRMS